MDQDLPLADLPAADPKAATFVHPTAVVEKGAQLGQGVYVGPFCVVGPKAQLGDRVRLESHVTVSGRTKIGTRTVVYQFSTLGVIPQDLKFDLEDAELDIGPENSIRQYVNISIGTTGGGGRTVIGRRNLLMAYVHVAHDCIIKDNVVFANGATLGGHVLVDHHAFLGGLSAVHQFCRVGTRTMTAGGSMVTQDIPPFCMVAGDRARPNGLNVVGLRRAGYDAEALKDLKTMYRLLYNENLTVEDAIVKMEEETGDTPHRRAFVEFLRSSERGVCR